jgi:CHAD domain-containing protein
MTKDTKMDGGAHAGAQPLQSWALALFDGTAAAHRLPGSARRLLQIAIGFYSAAGYEDGDQAARLGRDLALAAPIPGLTPDQQAIVAGAVALQRDKPRPRREPALLHLGDRDHKLAVRLAAILQLARALRADPTGSLLAHVDGEATTLVIGGEQAAAGAAAADARGELWRAQIGALTVRPAAPGELAAPIAAAPDRQEAPLVIDMVPPDQLSGGEPIAEGARRVLRRFFGRMLTRESAVLKDDDAEDVHQMRVASRRLRAALQVVEAVYDPKQIRRYRRGLRRVALALGDVRDLDVFREHVLAYQAALPAEAREGIAPLVAAIEGRRAEARAALLEDLRRRPFQKFKRAFAAFLTTPGAELNNSGGIDATTRVRDFAGSAIWRRYEQWRAHEVALASPRDEDLHEARIAGKRLRYTLEFFADALGPNIEQALAPLIALQECLGTLQDAVVARQRVHGLGLHGEPGVDAYLEARDAERAAQMDALPGLWEKVASATYRRRMWEMIVKL